MRQQRPHNAGILIGERHGRHIVVTSAHDSIDPFACWIGFIFTAVND
jgi:hypothetical protein